MHVFNISIWQAFVCLLVCPSACLLVCVISDIPHRAFILTLTAPKWYLVEKPYVGTIIILYVVHPLLNKPIEWMRFDVGGWWFSVLVLNSGRNHFGVFEATFLTHHPGPWWKMPKCFPGEILDSYATPVSNHHSNLLDLMLVLYVWSWFTTRLCYRYQK